jgi:hypothetical protein
MIFITFLSTQHYFQKAEFAVKDEKFRHIYVCVQPSVSGSAKNRAVLTRI